MWLLLNNSKFVFRARPAEVQRMNLHSSFLSDLSDTILSNFQKYVCSGNDVLS